jgi:hypothetical protein
VADERRGAEKLPPMLRQCLLDTDVIPGIVKLGYVHNIDIILLAMHRNLVWYGNNTTVSTTQYDTVCILRTKEGLGLIGRYITDMLHCSYSSEEARNDVPLV